MESHINRPYIICHMSATVNGKILFENFPDKQDAKQYSALYNQCHDAYESQGWILGRVSLENDFENEKPVLTEFSAVYPRTAHFADEGALSFAVTFDTSGKLGWSTNEIGGDHIIAVLTEDVSDAYLAYLRERKISYLFTGRNEADLRVSLQQLATVFGIKKIMLEGGAKLNAAFLNEGLMDELSVLLLPLADSTADTPTIFEWQKGESTTKVSQLRLKEVQQLSDDVVWLKYSIKKD
jgi:riboflavin biosynthesis pyrimidine reductase